MEYGSYYDVYQMAEAAEKILALIDKFSMSFFVNKDIKLPYDRREISCSIYIGKTIKSINNKIPLRSHPAIHSAISGIKFYEEKKVENDISRNEIIGHTLYTDLIWLIDSIIGLIFSINQRNIETKIQNKQNNEAIRILTIERQAYKYNDSHPEKFISRYEEYLNKRIKDFKELTELDKIDVGIELKEILISYKLGLEININGRNLLTPLLAKNYNLFIRNLKNTLLIPSYYDIQKNEKERFYHVYLLGILEGRLNFYKLQSNKESGRGRYDICAIPLNKSNPGLIIEIKSNNSKENAIEQIKVNEYNTELKNDGVKEILLMGIYFKENKPVITHEISIVS